MTARHVICRCPNTCHGSTVSFPAPAVALPDKRHRRRHLELCGHPPGCLRRKMWPGYSPPTPPPDRPELWADFRVIRKSDHGLDTVAERCLQSRPDIFPISPPHELSGEVSLRVPRVLLERIEIRCFVDVFGSVDPPWNSIGIVATTGAREGVLGAFADFPEIGWSPLAHALTSRSWLRPWRASSPEPCQDSDRARSSIRGEVLRCSGSCGWVGGSIRSVGRSVDAAPPTWFLAGDLDLDLSSAVATTSGRFRPRLA